LQKLSQTRVAVLTPLPPEPDYQLIITSWKDLGDVDFYFAGECEVPCLDLNYYFIHFQEKKYNNVKERWRKLFRIADARNLLLKCGRQYDYALFLDMDVEPPPNLISQLVSHGKDIVSPLVRVPTTSGTSWGFGFFKGLRKEEWYFADDSFKKDNGLLEVGAVCTSCMMLSSAILK